MSMSQNEPTLNHFVVESPSIAFHFHLCMHDASVKFIIRLLILPLLNSSADFLLSVADGKESGLSWRYFHTRNNSSEFEMSGSLVALGVGLAAVGFAGRYILRRLPNMEATMSEALKQFPKSFEAGSKYYKGGFEPKMSRREAALILGISPTASKVRIKECHKRIMLINHPDRGGSPYLASKINEAKDLMENNKAGGSSMRG